MILLSLMPKILVLSYTNMVNYLLYAIINSHRITIPTGPPKEFKVVFGFCFFGGGEVGYILL